MTAGTGCWTIAIALKGLAAGKSRLSPHLTDRERADLVVAMAGDVVAAARASAAFGRILVVTPEPDLAWRLGSDVVVLPERRACGLDDAYRRAIRAAGHRPLALVAADLPGLRAEDLDLLVTTAEEVAGPVVVADTDGTGTTVLASTMPGRLEPRFGTGSRAAHVAGGAADISDACSSRLRHDVDTWAALTALGTDDVGPHTRRWLGIVAPYDAVGAR
jgi:2-phospho-L-lactate guanylyltransferase